MPIIGGFLGGGVSMVPAGKHQVFLWWSTSDRKNISGATFKITPASGSPVTVSADQYGHAVALVDAGKVYTVTVSYNGSYTGVGPQQFEAISTESTPIMFYGEKTLVMRDVLDAMYPVGSIYMSVNATNPSTLIGGTWERIAQGRTLIGQGPSDQDFEAGTEGGESTHTLTINEIPSHAHGIYNTSKEQVGGTTKYVYGNSTYKNGSSEYEGGGEAHNNLPPYLVVYMWKRTA